MRARLIRLLRSNALAAALAAAAAGVVIARTMPARVFRLLRSNALAAALAAAAAGIVIARTMPARVFRLLRSDALAAAPARIFRLLRSNALASALAAAAAAGIVIALGLWVEPDTPLVGPLHAGWRFLDRGVLDLLLRARGPQPTDERIVIVEIDDPSLAAFGEFPLPRRHYTDFFRATRHAAAVGVDIFFTDASHRFSSEQFLDALAALEPSPADLRALARRAYEQAEGTEDRELADVLAEVGNVVLPASLPAAVDRADLLRTALERAKSAVQAAENERGAPLEAAADDAETQLRALARRTELPLTLFRRVLWERARDRERLVRRSAGALLRALDAHGVRAFRRWRDGGALRSAPVRASPEPPDGGTTNEHGQGEAASGFGLRATDDRAGATPTLKPGTWSLKPDGSPSPAAVLLWLADERTAPEYRAKFLAQLAPLGLGDDEVRDAEAAVRAEALWQELSARRTAAGSLSAAFDEWRAAQPGDAWADLTRLEDPRLRVADELFRRRLFAAHGAPWDGPPDQRGLPISPLAETLPLPRFLERLPVVGSVSSDLDSDGLLRHYVPVQRVLEPDGEERLYPSLALAVLLVARGQRMTDVEVAPGRSVRIPAGRGRAEVTVPLEPDGRLFINWAGRWKEVQTYRSFAEAVAAWRAGGEQRARIEEFFRDRYVLLGLTATGSHDLKPNPLQQDFPMVGAHAQVLNAVLTGRYFARRDPWVPRLSLAVPLLAGLIGLVVPRLRAYVWLAALAAAGAGWVLFARAEVAASRAVPVVEPLAALALGVLAALGWNYVAVERRQRRVQRTFSTYLAPQVVRQVLAAGGAHPGGETRELSVLFSDIAGFTTLAQSLEPAALVAFLNEYLGEMERIVTNHGGVVDKYIGDAVMAFFGAPGALPGHGRRATLAALRMQERLVELNARWRDRGYPTLGVRIGVNTGVVLVGNLGSPHKVDYTVIGDNVNLASRLESGSKFWGFSIMIAEASVAHLQGEAVLVRVGRLVVKGKTVPILVYGVLGRTGTAAPETTAAARAFEDALARFWARNFAAARAAFAALTEAPMVGKAAGRYVAMCGRFLDQPPADDWAGEFVMEEK